MFRIESYITSIILSYVDRYIKNFKRQDAQVSLWEGDGSLHNLDLDLEVLDQELNLPFSFVSGHIHELLIHVPWTRIGSEPVKITINTIECIMKLKPPGQDSNAKRERKKKSMAGEENVAPPSYMKSLVNKIIFNLSVTCNNLILKYVEEDIVLSMNIKTLSLSTVNKNWEPEFSELSLVQLILRNLVNLSDVTICLDKRNASGRIESYLEPILYKCSLTIRISRSFPTASSTTATTTRIGIHCENFSLSISEPQVPMLLRLFMLYQMVNNSPPISNTPSQLSLDTAGDDHSQGSDSEGQYESWSSWMWGFVPSILPMASEGSALGGNEDLQTLHLGLYINSFVLNFKLVGEMGGKPRAWENLGKLQFDNCFLEISKNSNEWTNIQLGVSLVTINPVPQFDDEIYLSCGQLNDTFMQNSLFENPDMDFPQRPWDVHLSTITENYLVTRAPAVSVDFLMALEVPADSWADNFLSEPREKVLTRCVIGPLNINVTNGLIDRINIIMKSIDAYEYPAYSNYGNSNQDLGLPIKGEKKYFTDSYISKRILQITVCEANIRAYAAQVAFNCRKAKKSLNTELLKTFSTKQLPYLLLKVKCLDISLSKPLRPETLRGLSLKNSSMEIFSDAMTTLSVGVMKMSAGVLVGESELVEIVDVHKTTVTVAYDSVLLIDAESISTHSTLQIGEVIFNGSKSKFLLAAGIINSFISPNLKNNVFKSSLAHDSTLITNVPFLKISLVGLHCMFVRSQVNESVKIRFGSMSGHTYFLGKTNRAKFTVITAGNNASSNILEAIAQRPTTSLNPTPFIFFLKLKQFHCFLDQSVFNWINYKPRTHAGSHNLRVDVNSSDSLRKVSTSSRSISSASKPKVSENAEVLEKAAEKETDVTAAFEDFEKKVEWLMKWLSVVVSADFTDVQFSFVASQRKNHVLVFKLPSLSLASSYGKLSVDSDELPVTFNAWVKNTPSFPWTADFNGLTGHFVVNSTKKETILDPFSIHCTIAVASKLVPSPSVAVSIHTDTSSISVTLGRPHMSTLAELLTCITQVANTVMAYTADMKNPDDPLPLEFSQESEESFSASNPQSTQQCANQKDSPKGNLKVSCWLQWTLAKCVFALVTTPRRNSTDSLKFVVEMEDIIFSTDMDLNDRVYQKVKLKIGTAWIRHFRRESPNTPWALGVYGGIVMRGHDTTGNAAEFLYLTFTRVLASNYHSKMSSLGHHSIKESIRQKMASSTRYVAELDLKIEPLDFVLAPFVLGKFVHVIEPMMLRKPAGSPAFGVPLSQYTTSDLPLIYLDIQQVRAFIPSSCLPTDAENQDTVVVHIDDVALRHEAVNPVSRKILRSDLYSSAQRARVTTLPGSQLEDRQYQLDFTLQINTGRWEELAPHVSGEQGVALDNPAVYWNSGVATALHKGACLSPVLSIAKICFVLAPPIVTSGFVVSGLNFEANVISELALSISLDQLRLLKAVLGEVTSVLPDSNDSVADDFPNTTSGDSGIESIDGSIISKSTPSVKIERVYRRANSSLVTVSSSAAINTKNLRQRTQTVPVDLLVVGKGVSVKLYSTDSRTSKSHPLLYLSISQPFVSVEKHGDSCIYKASVFDLSVKHGNAEKFTNGKVEDGDFQETIISTKDGDPDPYKGIPPALFNFKSVRNGMKLPNITADLGRPVKILSKLEAVHYLDKTRHLITSALDSKNSPYRKSSAHAKELTRIEEKKDRQLRISLFSFSTKQVVLEWVASGLSRKSIILGVSATSGSVNFPSLNQIYGTLSAEAIVVSICRRTCHIILNPWSLTVTGSLAWEPWISCPLLTVQLTSDILALEYSPKHIACFLEIIKEFHPLIVAKTDAPEGDTGCKTPEVPETSSTKSDEEDQYYKDDLQAGAFQFVNTDPQPDLPLAYQVVFPSQVHMAWAYPQPRCISSITVLPVPFDYPTHEGVSISLQYLDFLGWKDWIKFKVFETKIVDVDLPQKPQVASTWRVIVKEPNPPLHVQALAASLRVDSMFSPKLVPNVRLNVTLDSLQISAWAGPSRVIKLPPPLSRFAPDNPLPGEYPFAKMSVEHVKLRVLSWATNQLEVEGDFRGRVDVVNCKTLREQCVVQPFPAHINFETDPPNVANPKYSLAMTAGPILAYVSPSIGHTISAALNNAILMPVVLCNDTCFPVRIGQVGTNENITIQCLQCHFYAWRTTQQDMELKFSISQANDKLWSRPVATRAAGSIPLVLVDDNGKSQNVIVVIKKLSSTMTQVLISGELVVHNNLERSIDVRLVANSITERQRYVTVNPSSRAPSIVLTPDTKYNIRLGLQSQWSGLVPLFATSNSWLVKVPTKEKKDFISVWCQIFKAKEPNKRILIVISPMYLIKSLLPCDANVLIKTEELNVDKSLRVPGRGCISNLITPGTTAHNHSLTFHIDGNLPSSSPHVPLSYSAMDGRTPPLPPIPDVESLIDRSEAGPPSVPWPFLGPQWVKVLWRHANQPDTITHVKVRFCGDKLKVANSLMVELQPWALVINTLGLSIALQSTGRFLCALQHFCVLAPPPIEGTFYLLVELNDGYHKSSGLQLSDNQSFYKPQISGLIPLSDSVQIKVQAPNSVIFATIHSKIMSGIRILHVSSSYVISNLSDMDLSVAAFSVRKDAIKFRLPSEILYYAVHLPKNSSNNIVGEPLAEWHEIGHGDENGRRLYLIFERSGLVSNPVPLTLGLERSTATALLPVSDGDQVNICLEIVFQTKDNVVYITVDRQTSPQLVIHNRTRHLLTIAKSSTEQGGAAEEESEDWEWRFMLPAGKCGHYKCDVPNMSAALPPVVVARPDQNYWSTAISLMPSNGSRMVNLPQGQDLTATVLRIGYTIHLILAHASHSLIAASDVRSRLSINSQQDLLKDTTLAEACEDSPDQIKAEETSECEDLEKIKVSVLSRFDVTCFLHGVTFMLCSEPEGSFDWQEVAALTVDNVGITAQPIQNPDSGVRELAARITVWDIQIDNQEFHRGNYDFSVVLLRQGELDRSLFTGHNPHHLVETARLNSPAVDVSVLLNTNVKPVIQEVSVKAAPLQVYIEDEYLTQVNNHLTNLVPSLLIKGERRVMKKQISPAKSSISTSTMSSKVTETYLGSKECISAEPIGSADKAAKVETKTVEEEQDLFYVSDEEVELPVSYSPWKSASEQHKDPSQQVPDEDDEERYEILWSDDGDEEPALKIPIPDDVVSGTYDLSRPLKLKKFLIAPMEMSVSVHTSTKFYIALDQSPLSFSEFRRTNVVTTPFRLGHALSLHYFLGAIYGTGWALGSLQLLGAPAGLARSVGHGLKNFVTFPYEGFMEGPTGFLFGIMHGSASLMKHITAGTLSSVNKLAGSWSRTLDRLTLSPDDLRYAEEMRRIKPQGIADGIRQGLTEFGVSFLGGVGGLAQQPLEYATGGQGKSLVGSLGRGLVGVMARPISGAAELVALTAHGILSGAGWADIHIPKHQPVWQGVHQGAESRVKYEHKLVPKNQSLLFVCEATSTEFEPVVLVVTSSFLYVLNREDVIVKQLKLQDIAWSKDKFDPTMLTITVQTPDAVAEKLSQKRITEFVRESRRALNSASSDGSFAGQSASLPPTPPSSEQDPLKFFLNPQRRDHFVCILDLAARHASTKGFPVLT